MESIYSSIFVHLNEQNIKLKNFVKQLKRVADSGDIDTIVELLNNEEILEILYTENKGTHDLVGGTRGNKDVHNMTVKQLKDLCKKRGIIRYSNLKKSKLKQKCKTFRVPIFHYKNKQLPEDFQNFFEFVSHTEVVRMMLKFFKLRYHDECYIIGEGTQVGDEILDGIIYNVTEQEQDEDEEREFEPGFLQRLMEMNPEELERYQQEQDDEDVFDFEDDNPNKGTLMIPEDVEEQIYGCEDENKRFIIINLHLNNEVHDAAHANILIFDTVNKTLERFESYGKIPGDPPMFDENDIDEQIKKFISDPLEYEYIKPLKFCPVKSFQEIQEETEQGEENLCQAWALWYSDMRLRYPDMDRSALVRRLLDIQKRKGGLDQYLKGFIEFFIDVYNSDPQENADFEPFLQRYTKL